jgi:hypothetical protein
VTPLFNWVGVDYRQWRAISRTLLRADFRVPLAQSGEAYSLRTVRGLLMMAVVNGLVGLASAFVVFVNTDVVLTGTIVLSYVALVLAPSVLTQHGASMLSTSDYLILGPRPVSSRTFLAIRLTNILFHALLTTTFVAIAPIVAFGLAHGPRVGRALAAACAIYAWAIALTLALGAGYGALLRLVGVARLQRAVAYLQLGVGLLMYGGVLLSSQLLGGVATTATMPAEPWPWAIPPAWFAGYVAMAMGNASAEIWVRAALSVVVIGLLLIALRGRLGLDYASRLSELAVTPAPTARSRSPITPLFTTREPRAVALLVLAHFRHDLRVRMGVLGVLPLLVLYTILGSDNPVSDPFVVAPPGSPDFIALAVLLFPAVLAQQFSSSESYKASWIYTVSPADRARLVIALKNLAVVYFLVPFLLLVAALYMFRSPDVSHALTHTALLGLVSHLALQGSVWLNPQLPFARPPDKTTGNAGLFAWMIVVILGGQLLIWTLPRLVYVSWTRVGLVGATLVALTLLLNRAIAVRVRATPN